jgi:hypothetical protein
LPPRVFGVWRVGTANDDVRSEAVHG